MRESQDRIQDLPANADRIAVVGTAGSCKTMLAKELCHRLGGAFVELDALNWGPDWTPEQPNVLREKMDRALNGNTWVADGNYGFLRDIVWRRADTLVWLDYPLRVVLSRLLWRTVRRTVTREELWLGNRERFWAQFLSRDLLFLWVLRTYWGLRREFPDLLGQPEHAHLRLVHLRSPGESRRWLSALPRRNPGSSDGTF